MLLHFIHDRFECFGMIHREVGKYLAVNFYFVLVQRAHETGIRHTVFASSSVNTLYPERAEVAFFVLSITVGVS